MADKESNDLNRGIAVAVGVIGLFVLFGIFSPSPDDEGNKSDGFNSHETLIEAPSDDDLSIYRSYTALEGTTNLSAYEIAHEVGAKFGLTAQKVLDIRDHVEKYTGKIEDKIAIKRAILHVLHDFSLKPAGGLLIVSDYAVIRYNGSWRIAQNMAAAIFRETHLLNRLRFVILDPSRKETSRMLNFTR